MFGINHSLSYINNAAKEKELKEIMFSYNRKAHLNYLKSITKTGTYEEYLKEIENLKDLQQKIKQDGAPVKVVIDQADGIYWGDIMFMLDRTPMTHEFVSFKTGEASEILNKYGITANQDSFYYNKNMNAIMYTAVAIKANGPEMYSEEARLNRQTFLVR